MGGESHSPPILFCNQPARSLYIISMTAFFDTAIHAARAAGELLRKNFGAAPDVAEFLAHDIKLDLGMEAPKLEAGQLYFLSPTFVN